MHVLFAAFTEAPNLFHPFLIVVFVVLVMIGAAIIPVVLWNVLRWALRILSRRRLLRCGIPVPARITAAQLWGHPMPTIDDVVLAELRMETLLEIPRRILPVREWIDAEWAAEVGDQLWLLVDPKRPDRYCLAPPGRHPRPTPPFDGELAAASGSNTQ